MTLEEALILADLWSEGRTYRTSSEGWRPVSKQLADEVRRLRRALVGGRDDINKALIDEREALAAQNQQMREALEATNDDGRDERTIALVEESLNLPNLATDILRKRDTETLRNAADWFESAPVEYAFRARTVLLSMIKELESGK